MPKAKYVLFAVLAIAAGGIFAFGRRNMASAPMSGTATSSLPFAHAPVAAPAVTIGETVIPVELATTTAAREKGLSGRVSLAPDKGMLFVFEKAAIYRFWMPDMHFPLDMIWIDQGRVVDISADVPITFDPRNPRFYSPRKPARYVLEVNAGFSARNNIKTGDAIAFNGI